jgi:hypothetical protein
VLQRFNRFSASVSMFFDYKHTSPLPPQTFRRSKNNFVNSISTMHTAV